MPLHNASTQHTITARRAWTWVSSLVGHAGAGAVVLTLLGATLQGGHGQPVTGEAQQTFCRHSPVQDATLAPDVPPGATVTYPLR